MAQNTVEVNRPHQWDVYPLSKLLPCRLLLAIPVSQTETCSMQTLMSLSCSAFPNLVSECRGQDMSERRNNLHKSQEAVGTTRLQALKGRYYLYVGGGVTQTEGNISAWRRKTTHGLAGGLDSQFFHV